MPIVEVAKLAKSLLPGDTVQVTANDPVFEADVRAWCKRTSNELVEVKQTHEGVSAVIRIVRAA